MFLLTEVGERLSLYITLLANGIHGYTVAHKICLKIFCNLIFQLKLTSENDITRKFCCTIVYYTINFIKLNFGFCLGCVIL